MQIFNKFTFLVFLLFVNVIMAAYLAQYEEFYWKCYHANRKKFGGRFHRNYYDNKYHFPVPPWGGAVDCLVMCILDTAGLYDVETAEFKVDRILNALGGFREITKETVDKCIAEVKCFQYVGCLNCWHGYLGARCYFLERARDTCENRTLQIFKCPNPLPWTCNPRRWW